MHLFGSHPRDYSPISPWYKLTERRSAPDIRYPSSCEQKKEIGVASLVDIGGIYWPRWTPTCRWGIAGVATCSWQRFRTPLFFNLLSVHEQYWQNNCLGTGLAHRCAHRILKVRAVKPTLAKRISSLRNWHPIERPIACTQIIANKRISFTACV